MRVTARASKIAFLAVLGVLVSGLTPVAVASAAGSASAWTRVAGADRYETAAAVSKSGFPSGASSAVVASGELFPDGLSASYLAGQVGGPVLLTRSSSIPATTLAELARLGTSMVYVTGGTGAVSTAVEAQLAALKAPNGSAVAVRRLAGADRYATAAAIAAGFPKESIGTVGGERVALLASGTGFADALAGSAAAAGAHLPLLLTRRDSLSLQVLPTLKALGVSRVMVLGGTGVISTTVAKQLTDAGLTVTRLGGADRVATATLIASWELSSLGFTGDQVAVARGDEAGQGVDALSLGAFIGRDRHPLLLAASPSVLGGALLSWLRADTALTGGVVAGGPAAISDSLMLELSGIVGGAGAPPSPPMSPAGEQVTPRSDTLVASVGQIQAVSGQPSGTQVVTLAAGVPVPRVGGHIVARASVSAPDGLLVTVQSTVVNPDGTATVATIPATLDEAFSQFHVWVHDDLPNLQTDPSASMQPLAGGPSSRKVQSLAAIAPAASGGLGIKWSAVDFDCGPSPLPVATVTVDMSKTRMDFDLNAFTPSIDFLLSSDPKIDLDLKIGAELSCVVKRPLKISIPVATAPPLVIELSPQLELNAQGDVRVNFNWSPSLKLGFRRAPGVSSDTHVFSSTGSVAYSGNVGAGVYLAIKTSFLVAGRVGVSGSFGPYLEGKATTNGSGACVDVDLGLKSKLAAEIDLWVKQWTFAVAEGVFGTKNYYHQCTPNPTPPNITTTTVTSATVGTPYITTLAVTGGKAPIAWSVASGALPPGLSLSSAGTISGTPSTPGTSNFTVAVRDSAGATAQRALTLAVIPGAGGPGGFRAGSVSAGGEHTCAVTLGGAVKCWGGNFSGELGNGTTTNSATPVDVVGLGSGVASVSAGWARSCAVTTGGAVKCWGYNVGGLLGDSTTTGSISSTPVGVVGFGSGVSAVSVGQEHSCAVTTLGAVKCWGWNSLGELGDGTTTDSATPVGVVGLGSGVASVSAGYHQSCVVTTGGAVKCWGSNSGNLGNGTTTPSRTPVGVVGLSSGVASVSAGWAQSCAVTTGGAVKCWGYNRDGALGNGTTTTSTTPVGVVGLGSGAASVSAGFYRSCAVTSGAAVKCWGYNRDGALGNGTTTDSSVPVGVGGLGSGVSAVSGSFTHSCAVTTDGAVRCWGDNGLGELGDGTTTNSSTPVAVIGLP